MVLPTRGASSMLGAGNLQQTGLYREVEGFYRALHAPGTGAITDASDVSVRPDGAQLAFTATTFPDLAQAAQSCIGLLDLSSGTLTVRDGGHGNERLPRHSPDGKRLAFLSDRSERGNFQLHVADLDAGSVEAFPPLDGVIENLSWSPDGSRLLLGVAGFGADMAGCQGGATTPRRAGPEPAWAPVIDSGDGENLWRSGYVADLATQRYHRATPLGLNVWECAWLDERELIAVVSASHSEGSWYTAHLAIIEIESAAARPCFRPRDQIGCPTVSPNGRYVAVIEAVCSDRLIVCGELKLIDRDSGDVRIVDTAAVDVTQASFRDDATLVFVGLRGLATVLGEAGIDGGSPMLLWSSLELTIGNWYPSFALAPDEGVIAVAEGYAIAPRIVRIDRDGCHLVRSLAAPRGEGCVAGTETAEPFTWEGRDGRRLEGWLVRPAGAGPFALVMDIHGGPVWCCRNRWQGRLRGARILADHGVATLHPNPRGSSGRGNDFARLVKGDMGGEDTHDYLSALDALVARRIADPARLGVTGISYGGFMSAWLVTQDRRFAAAVPISPVTDWYSQHRTSQIPHFDALFLDAAPAAADGLFFERSPVMHAGRVTTPVLQLTGGLDQNTPPTQALEFHRSLLEHGARSVLVTYPNAGHGIRGFPEVIDATTRYVAWFLEHFDQARDQG